MGHKRTLTIIYDSNDMIKYRQRDTSSATRKSQNIPYGYGKSFVCLFAQRRLVAGSLGGIQQQNNIYLYQSAFIRILADDATYTYQAFRLRPVGLYKKNT